MISYYGTKSSSEEISSSCTIVQITLVGCSHLISHSVNLVFKRCLKEIAGGWLAKQMSEALRIVGGDPTLVKNPSCLSFLYHPEKKSHDFPRWCHRLLTSSNLLQLMMYHTNVGETRCRSNCHEATISTVDMPSVEKDECCKNRWREQKWLGNVKNARSLQ